MPDIKKILVTAAGAVMIGAAQAASAMFSTAEVDCERFPVMGVDVSHYQGEIDWSSLAQQNVKFAFIKATEGSGHVDEYAEKNLKNASETDILLSAYHFFSFDSAGETQAENFISVVDSEAIDMPPVVDIEYYADKRKDKPAKEETAEILRPLLEAMEEHYGEKPIIYTTLPVYYRYIRDGFSDYPLWIRSVNFEPEFVDWQFWQYSDKGELYGFSGDEKYIDLNVYKGSEEEFFGEYRNGGTEQ
ncbi:MAG: glycosyl hydrolase family 25 [Ruminococcus sp.]|nr:glycosyl hydrolase family 25 [Ruminococcus sp.]